MSGIATAIGVSAVVGYAGQQSASKAQQKGVEKGMAAEERIAAKNLAFQEEMAEQQRLDFQPWRETGEKALTRLWEGVESGEFVMGAAEDFDFKADPAYDFRLQQGIEARDKSASARGRLDSGAQAKAITEYGQDFASQEYANAYARESDRKARQFNILSGLSQGGQAAADGQAGSTSQLSSQTGNILANLGRSQNVSAQQGGAARASGYTGGATAVNQAAQNWLLYKNLGGGSA